MQLKRDTEFAMQIMVCIAERQKEDKKMTGVPTSEVITETRIPLVTFQRICGYLEERQLIRKETMADGDSRLYPGKNFWGQSLLSIAEAVEGNMQIFVIFNRNTSLVQKYGAVFKDAQKEVSKSLSNITLDMLVNQTV